MALTEWYVNDASSGTGTGTTEANAMSFNNFIDYMSTGGTKTASPGDRFNIKGAITARTNTTDTWLNGGTVTSPVIVRGYNSTIGDLTSLARTNGNGPLVTTNYPTISYTTGGIVISGNFVIVEALSISGANIGANTGVVRPTGTDNVLKRCAIVNSSTNANAAAFVMSGARTSIIDCDVSLTGASGGDAAIVNNVSSARVIGCRIKGGPNIGYKTSSATGVVAFNTIFVSTGIGISQTATSSIGNIYLYNTIVGGGADGVNILTGTTATNIFIGHMITDNTGDGIDMVSTANAAYVSNLRTRDNATSINNGGDWITATNYDAVTTDTGGPETDYTNSGGNDYSLLPYSPAVQAGNPFYLDVGGLQALIPPEVHIPSIGSI